MEFVGKKNVQLISQGPKHLNLPVSLKNVFAARRISKASEPRLYGPHMDEARGSEVVMVTCLIPPAPRQV